jgi:hypothetical protein
MGFSLRQAVIEIQFSKIDMQKELDYFDTISNNLKKIYGSSKYDFNNKAFTLASLNGVYNCTLTPETLSINSNCPCTVEEFCKITEETMKEFRENSLLDNIGRIGFRTFNGKDYDSLQLANESISKKFDFGNTVAKFFTNKIGDVRAGFSTKEDVYTLNYNFSAATNREIQMNNGTIGMINETYCVLVDLDIFVSENCKYSNIFEYLTNFKDLTNKKIRICESIF